MTVPAELRFTFLALLLAGCSNPVANVAPAGNPTQWVKHNELKHAASDADLAVAKSSEVAFRSGQADIGNGLRLVLVLGDLIGSRSFSTTSYYNLVDTQGRSLARLPSRLHKSEDNLSRQAETKVWASPSTGIVLVYESLPCGSGDMEFHGLIHKLENGEWLAHGVNIPHWKEPEVLPEGVSANPTFHEGPFVTGVANEGIVLLPVRNVYYVVQPDELKITHPFPFSPG